MIAIDERENILDEAVAKKGRYSHQTSVGRFSWPFKDGYPNSSQHRTPSANIEHEVLRFEVMKKAKAKYNTLDRDMISEVWEKVARRQIP